MLRRIAVRFLCLMSSPASVSQEESAMTELFYEFIEALLLASLGGVIGILLCLVIDVISHLTGLGR